jgi:hypothetical protein
MMPKKDERMDPTRPNSLRGILKTIRPPQHEEQNDANHTHRWRYLVTLESILKE